MAQKPHSVVCGFLLKRKAFSLNDVVSATGIERRRVLRVLDKLRREGFLEMISEEKVRPGRGKHGPFRKNPHYRRIKDISLRAQKPKRYCGRDRIWRTIRFLRKFKRSDLVRLTGDKETTVQVYTRHLVLNGYLKDLGRSGREKVFFLINDPGPKRPIIEGE